MKRAWPPIYQNKPAITPKWFNSLDTNSIVLFWRFFFDYSTVKPDKFNIFRPLFSALVAMLCYALPACSGALTQLSHSTQFVLQYRAVTDRNQTTRFISKTISSNRSVPKFSLLLWQVVCLCQEIKWVLCESSFSDHPLKKNLQSKEFMVSCLFLKVL